MPLIDHCDWRIDSERGIAWRVADSLSLREFIGYKRSEPTPDHGHTPAPSGVSGALALAPVWAQLAIVLVLGLAMPGPIVDWLRLLAEAAR